MKKPPNLKKTLKILEPPLSRNYKYYGIHFQKFLDQKKDGLTPNNALRFLQNYSETRTIGMSSKSNLRKAIIHIVRLTLFRARIQEQEIYYREALKLFKIRLVTKTVMSNDIPTPEDLRLAKENSDIRLALLIDFINTTSLRVTETIKIKLSNCRFEKISQGYSIRFLRKGGYEFETWIPKELYENIVIEFGSTIWLFQSPVSTKKHIAVGTVQKWMRDASKFTTRPIRPHLIRHKSINEVIKENPQIPLHELCEDAFSEATVKKYYLVKANVDVTAINKQHFENYKNLERESK